MLTRARVAERLLGQVSEPVHLGRYELRRKLGQGAMGEVYEGWDPRLQRCVALKVLRPDRLGRSNAVARLAREARAMARVVHPNVVQVFDVDEVGSTTYIAMELVRGTTLAHWLQGDPPLRAILATFAAIGEGLAAAHAQGVVHRDFKPHNVLLGPGGNAKIGDFGLALIREPSTQSRMTETGAVLGTPVYMAPELHHGEAATPASDQFAFCVALHEAVYGDRPWDDALPTVASGSSWRHRALDKVLRRGLALRPAARHTSMSELALALRELERSSWRDAPGKLALALLPFLGSGLMLAGFAAPPPAAARLRGLELAPTPAVEARLPTWSPASLPPLARPLGKGESRGSHRRAVSRRSSPARATTTDVRRELARKLTHDCGLTDPVTASFVLSSQGRPLAPLVRGGSPHDRGCIVERLVKARLEGSSEGPREVELRLEPHRE